MSMLVERATPSAARSQRPTGVLRPSWRAIGHGLDVNETVLDHHSSQVDALLSEGVSPVLSLFRDSLPGEVAAFGGWTNPKTIDQYVDYVGAVAARLGDRVDRFVTLSSPQRYLDSVFRPERESLREAADNGMLTAAHHMLIAHGRAVEMIKAHSPMARVGIGLEPHPVEPDIEASDTLEQGWSQRWLPHALAWGTYPTDVVEEFGWDQAAVQPGDDAIIASTVDFVAINAEHRPGVMIDFLALEYGLDRFYILNH